MKRKVLCIFSLIAYLLLFCTCVAPAVQQEMTVLADVKKVSANARANTNLPAYSGIWGNEKGLYQIVEGTGWDTGDRVAQIAPKYYKSAGYHIVLHPGTAYTVILSASQTPEVGDRVDIADTKMRSGEKLILYSPEGVSQITQLPNIFTVLQQGEQGMLLDAQLIVTPFFEHRIMESFKDRMYVEGLRIYSYSDALSFLWQLPLVALVGGLFLVGLILWGGACRMTKNANRTGLVAGISGLAMGAVLLLIFCAAAVADLPASLMPPENLFQVSHYVAEFSNMFAAVDDVGLTVTLICAAVLSILVLLAGIAGGIALLRRIEKLLMKWNTRL